MIAFSLFLILAITIGLRFLKGIKWQNGVNLTGPPLQAMLATSLIAGIILACLDGVLIMPASQVAMILIAGWVLSLSGMARSLSSPALTASTPIIAALLLASFTLVFAAREITQAQENNIHHEPDHQMAPRFWQDGKACGQKRGSFFE
jgi:hypothetical protein